MNTERVSSRDQDIPVLEKQEDAVKNFVDGKEDIFLPTGEGRMNLFYTLPFLWCLTNGNKAMKIVW